MIISVIASQFGLSGSVVSPITVPAICSSTSLGEIGQRHQMCKDPAQEVLMVQFRKLLAGQDATQLSAPDRMAHNATTSICVRS
jgi:hypothetical protein